MATSRAGWPVEIGPPTKDISREDIEGFEFPRGIEAAAPFTCVDDTCSSQAEGLNGAAKVLVADRGDARADGVVFPAPDDAPLILDLHPETTRRKP